MTSTPNKGDVYEFVTSRIITQLSNGIVPWKISWTGNSQPQNMLSRNKYRGINTWILLGHGYAQNLFISEAQVKILGASIKPNQTGYLVVFWKALEGEEKPSIQSITLFNMDQCSGIPLDKIPVPVNASMHPIKKCEALLDNMPNPPKIVHVELDTLYYDPTADYINIPPMQKFESSDLYYKTLFNELVRSVFHPTRLVKQEIEIKQCNAEPFTLEALVAEMGGSYLSSWAGLKVQEVDEEVSTLTSWIKVFKEDRYFVVKAATIAQKAIDFIMSGGKEEVKEPIQISATLEDEKPQKKSARKRVDSK